MFLGPILPSNLIQDNPEFDFAPPSSYLEGFKAEAQSMFFNSPIADFINMGREEYYKHLEPGTLLSKEEWEKSQYFRKGIDFDAIKSSQNLISENVARIVSERHDKEVERQAVLNNMPSGFTSGLIKFLGGAFGFLLDPVNVGAGVLADSYIGIKSAAVLSELEEASFAQRTITKFGLGATVGGTVVAPQAFSQFAADSLFGEDPSQAATMATIAEGAALGGILHSIFGFKKPITEEANRLAKQTAVNQVLAGKSVRVEDIVEQGMYEARLEDTEPPIEQHEEAIRNVKEEQKAYEDKIAEIDRQLEDDTYAKDSRPDIGDMREAATNIEDFRKGLEKDKEKFQQEISRLKKIQRDHEIALELSNHKGTGITKDRLKAKSDYINTYESDSAYDQQLSEEFNQELKTIPEETENFDKELKERVETMKDQNLLDEEQQDNLDKVNEFDSKVERLKNVIRQAANCLRGSD